MAYFHSVVPLAAGSFVLVVTGCAAPFSRQMMADARMLPPDGSIEMAFNNSGQVLEVEFHLSPNELPRKVLEAVEAKLPGGEIEDCEKEYEGGQLYYEVSKVIAGRETEMMVTPAGRVHLYEIAIDASEAPPAILAAADRSFPGGIRRSVEKILDRHDRLIEYHVKKTVNDTKYKIMVAPDGTVRRAFREIPAEIEVPVAIAR